MALAVASSGTQTATINTEHSLATLTAGKTYVLKVDTVNMVNGDTLELRIKEKVLSGGASGQEKVQYYQHIQGEPIKLSDPWPANIELVATLKQTAGTGRAFPWAILSLD